MGKPPPWGAAPRRASDAVTPSALNAFEIKTDVPAGLVSGRLDGRRRRVRDVSGDVVQMVSQDIMATIAVQPMQVRLRIPREGRYWWAAGSS